MSKGNIDINDLKAEKTETIISAFETHLISLGKEPDVNPSTLNAIKLLRAEIVARMKY